MKTYLPTELPSTVSTKLFDLFTTWLQKDNSKTLILDLIKQVKNGYPLYIPPANFVMNAQSNSQLPIASPIRASPHSSPLERSRSFIKTGTLGRTKKIVDGVIPPFYSKKKEVPDWKLDKSNLNDVFKKADNKMRFGNLLSFSKDLFHTPSFYSVNLFKRIYAMSYPDVDVTTLDNPYITLEMALKYWEKEIVPYDESERLFRLTKQPENDVILPEDFDPILNVLVETHSGLDFLKDSPEFQPKYTRTVIDRIFYTINKNLNRQITLSEWKRSNFVETCELVDSEDDINLITDYFSYEHFYVIYCKFYELDEDHDMLLKREDLLKYEEHTLTQKIVDRIFQGCGHPTMSDVPDCICYDDFVYFILSEEDKSTPASLCYWFRCIDLDGDGKIQAHEMEEFYTEQVNRMESLGYEVIPFIDVLCQLCDLLLIKDDTIYLKDLVKPKVIDRSGILFDQLFNLQKFTNFENRDPFVLRQQKLDLITPWNRWAGNEYIKLSNEDSEYGNNEFK